MLCRMTSPERRLAILANGRPNRQPCQVHGWNLYTYRGVVGRWSAYARFGDPANLKAFSDAARNVLIKSRLLGVCACLFASLAFGATSPSIGILQVFPTDNPWNWDISGYAVHPNSANYIASIGGSGRLHADFGTVYNGAPNGIPYTVVNSAQPKVPINFTDYGDESDPGPYPIPLTAPVEGGPQGTGDRHVIAVDTSNKMLYELFAAYPQANRWDAACGAKYNLASNALRPETWTSADAAGLPIFPGLVRYEEVYIEHRIDHALRFTVQNSQKAYLWPARHYASSSTDTNRPPMGLRFRLKASFDTTGFSAPVRVILAALMKYGMIVADNGSNWYISGAPDDRWNDNILAELGTIAGSNFEAVRTVDGRGEPIYPAGSSIGNLTARRMTRSAGKNTPGSLYDLRGRFVCGWNGDATRTNHLVPGIYFFVADAGSGISRFPVAVID